jgi:Flp pilus assembly protein CpaB
MQNRTPIIASLLAGLVAVILVNLYVSSIQEAARPNMTRVAVASRDIKGGAILDGKDLTMAWRSTDSLPKLHVKWDERNLFIGQQIQTPIAESDYLLASYFGSQGVAAQRLSEKIDLKTNQRAFTIPLTNETSLERSIRPGDRVDLILTFTKTEVSPAARAGAPAVAGQKLVTTPLLENVYVLFTGRYGSGSSVEYTTMTVQVSGEEAQLIIWGLNQGRLSVLLRNPKDLQSSERPFLSGDSTLLSELGKQPLKIDDVVSKHQAAK